MEAPEYAVTEMLNRIAESCRQARIRLNHTQAEQADLAEISLRAAQKIEAGESGQTTILFKYLFSLGMLSDLYTIFPDPNELTPLEALSIQKKVQQARPKRVSKARLKQQSKPQWGDDTHGN